MGLEGGNFFGYSLGHHYVFGEHRPAQTDVWQEFTERRRQHGYDPAVALAVEQERLGAKIAAGDHTGLRGAIGTPDQLREFLRRYEEAGVDQVIFVLQAGKNRHEDIMSSLELFGTEVLPEFEERHEARERAKAERLAPAIEAALVRRTEQVPPPPPMPEGYTITAVPKRLATVADVPATDDQLDRFATARALGDRATAAGIIGG